MRFSREILDLTGHNLAQAIVLLKVWLTRVIFSLSSSDNMPSASLLTYKPLLRKVAKTIVPTMTTLNAAKILKNGTSSLEVPRDDSGIYGEMVF